jgi:type II secretory pathway pseudopilin PulG
VERLNLKLLRGSGGFTYIMALTMLVVMGILITVSTQTWQMVMAREREKELLFRGLQYQNAIQRWYDTKRPGRAAAFPLNELKDLLEDPNTLTKTRYLRKLYPDPLTGKEFEVFRGPPTGGIIGVFSPISSASIKPIKQFNFPPGLEEFEGKKKYSDWKFMYKPGATTGGAAVPGTTQVTTPGTGGSTTGAIEGPSLY